MQRFLTKPLGDEIDNRLGESAGKTFAVAGSLEIYWERCREAPDKWLSGQLAQCRIDKQGVRRLR
jgi:hypothetical protein